MDGWDDATMQRQPAIHRRPTTPRKTIHQSIPSALSRHGRCISPAHPSKPRVSLSPSLRHPYTNIPSSLLSNTSPSESVEHSAAADMQPQPGPTQTPQHSATQASRTHGAAADTGFLMPKRACDPVASGLRRHRPDDDPGYAYSGPRSLDFVSAAVGQRGPWMPLVTPCCCSQMARLTVVEVLAEGRCAGVSSPLDRQMDLFILSPLRLSISISINHAHYKCVHMGICRRILV